MDETKGGMSLSVFACIHVLCMYVVLCIRMYSFTVISP